MSRTMELIEILERNRTESVDHALAGLSRATLPHYSASDAETISLSFRA